MKYVLCISYIYMKYVHAYIYSAVHCPFISSNSSKNIWVFTQDDHDMHFTIGVDNLATNYAYCHSDSVQ